MATTSLLRSFNIPDIRKKVFVTLALLALYRFIAHVPVPNVNHASLKIFFESNNLLNLLSIFSGGGLSNMSIIAVGLGPYISASIIIQIFTMIIPSLEALSKEGSFGRQKINQYTQFLTLPLALAQSYGVYALIAQQNLSGIKLFNNTGVTDILVMVLIMTAGTYLLMFLGQLITEYGVGQGTSLLIFAGIISGLPAAVGRFYSVADSTQVFSVIVFIAVSAVVIASVIYVTQAYRKIEIQYSGRMRNGQAMGGGRSFIPVKINQAGVIPIIFAVSLVIVPNFLATYLQKLPSPMLSNVGVWLSINFNTTSILYNVTYFFLVFGFTYFYTSITFNPEKISEEIRKSGGFIPGIRPGSATTHYLKYVINRLTLAGGVFLGLIAVMPSVVQAASGITTLAVGGTGLLIVVSVILETVKQVESQIISRDYDTIAS